MTPVFNVEKKCIISVQIPVMHSLIAIYVQIGEILTARV